MAGARPERGQGLWLATIRRYLSLMAAASLAWETAQLPFYTLWRDGTPGGIAFVYRSTVLRHRGSLTRP
jgi:hypothetical protein